jgi:hypothetical protein
VFVLQSGGNKADLPGLKAQVNGIAPKWDLRFSNGEGIISNSSNRENRMNRGSAVVLGLLAAVSLLWGQKQIENPEKPEHPEPGRVLKLTEVLRIPGEGEGYYHNGANRLECDRQGNIYFHDFWTTSQRIHLLKFTADGRFIGDFYRQGEGPGEVQSALDFALGGEHLFIYDYVRDKIIQMTLDGTFVREYKRAGSNLNDVIGKHRDWLVCWDKIYPPERKQTKMYEIKNVIVLAALDGSNQKELYTFINEQFLISPAQGWGMMSWDPFISVLGDGKLFVCRTRDYGIEALDLDSGKITSRFTRRYRRVRHVSLKGEIEFQKKFNTPTKKYETDIKDLLFDGSRLWVKTSKIDPDKGILFDVFDTQGQFLDNFFIAINGWVNQVQGDLLYVSERDEEELPYVVIYRIDW